jgi:uncharacterized protein YlxW (UPF0749 family)
MTKPKTVKESLENLQQSVGQLRESLKSAHHHQNITLAKDIERSIKVTEMVIKRLKDAAVKKQS